ncbi:MAG: hypothetical protein PUD63_03430, partial [Clostridia bacterium]|nr:hypothetical protein [Clostridia bacterium]
MPETKTITPGKNARTIQIVICVLLVAAIVLAAIAFSGRSAALNENAVLAAKIKELTTSVSTLKQDAAAAQAELDKMTAETA